MNRIRFKRNRQNVCFFLAGNRAWPAVPGNQASKNWNGLSKMSEDPLSSCPKKATFAWPKQSEQFVRQTLVSERAFGDVLHDAKQSVAQIILRLANGANRKSK